MFKTIGSALIALTATTALTTAQARPFELEDLAKLQSVGSIAVSPDGGAVAYTLSVPRDLLAGDEDGTRSSHLYLLDEAGSTKFIGGKDGVSGISFSPDGAFVHFISKRDDAKHRSLYRIFLGGGEAEKVFEFDRSISSYVLSDDGKTLYFTADEETEDKKDLKKKGFNAYAYEEDLTFRHLWKVDLSEAAPEAALLSDAGQFYAIELSPDGRTIAAGIAPTPLVDDSYMNQRIRLIDTRNGRVRATVKTPGKLGMFRFSPDGSKLAFLAGTDRGDTSDGVLMVANTRNGNFEQLTPDAEQHIQDIEWLNDNEILANAHRSVESALVVYNTDGDEVRTLPTDEDIAVRNIEVEGSTLAYTADSPMHPNALFTGTVDGGQAEKRTNHNAWLDEIDFAEQTTYTYEARDGRMIDGLLITPQGRKPAGGWPLILVVHGGPEAHYSDGWLTRYSNPGQFGAGDGFAVFYPNYRGSTGRGVAFSKEHQDDYAGKEFNDLVDGVEALAEGGIINRDKVGITGGSYGGYASMWGATALTDHFAASVAFVGISNQVSKFGTSDIPEEMYYVHSLRWPWDGDGEAQNWLNLLQRSPIYHAGKSKTPTLILHGQKDTRVHPSQSMELYRSMKVRTDTPVRLVFYPDEGHGNRKAASQYDYGLRLMRWMDHYLKGDGGEPPAFDLNIEDKLKGDDDE